MWSLPPQMCYLLTLPIKNIFMVENVQNYKGEILPKLGYNSNEISIKTQKYYFWKTSQSIKVKMWKKS